MLLGAWPRLLLLQGALTLHSECAVREGVFRQAQRRHRGCRKVPQAMALKGKRASSVKKGSIVDGSSANPPSTR